MKHVLSILPLFLLVSACSIVEPDQNVVEELSYEGARMVTYQEAYTLVPDHEKNRLAFEILYRIYNDGPDTLFIHQPQSATLYAWSGGRWKQMDHWLYLAVVMRPIVIAPGSSAEMKYFRSDEIGGLSPDVTSGQYRLGIHVFRNGDPWQNRTPNLFSPEFILNVRSR